MFPLSCPDVRVRAFLHCRDVAISGRTPSHQGCRGQRASTQRAQRQSGTDCGGSRPGGPQRRARSASGVVVAEPAGWGHRPGPGGSLVGEPTSFDRQAGAGGDRSGKSSLGAKPRLPAPSGGGQPGCAVRHEQAWPRPGAEPVRASAASGLPARAAVLEEGAGGRGRRPEGWTRSAARWRNCRHRREFREGKHGKERSDPVRAGRRPPGSGPKCAYPSERG